MTDDQDGLGGGRYRHLRRWRRQGAVLLAIGVLVGAAPAWQEWRPDSFAKVPASACFGAFDEATLRALMVDNEDVTAAQDPLKTAHLEDFGHSVGACGSRQGEHELIDALVSQDSGYSEPLPKDVPPPKQRPSLLLQSVYFPYDVDHGGGYTSEGSRVYFRCWSQSHEADHFSVPFFMDVVVLGRAPGYGRDQGRLTPHQRRLMADAALKLARVVSSELHCDAGIQLPAEPPAEAYAPATVNEMLGVE
jgi:hypothetical protein